MQMLFFVHHSLIEHCRYVLFSSSFSSHSLVSFDYDWHLNTMGRVLCTGLDTAIFLSFEASAKHVPHTLPSKRFAYLQIQRHCLGNSLFVLTLLCFEQ
jgi:hypothetical protein